jgi:hypothetical protein
MFACFGAISRMDITLQEYRLGDIATRAMKLEECITMV